MSSVTECICTLCLCYCTLYVTLPGSVTIAFTSVVYFDDTERTSGRSARKSERRHQLSLYMASEEVEDKTKQNKN